jgi:hypothetical protein
MTNENRGLTPSTIIERTWEGIAGAILNFPVSIALSGKMAAERENNTLLSPEERAERLLDFRFKTLADVLTEPPYIIYIKDLTDALEAKQADALARRADLTAEETAKIKSSIRLTKEQVEALRHPFPGFPELEEGNLRDVAYNYFSQTDKDGRRTFQLLIEEVIADYWYWVTPRPTISVSAFTQGK